MKVRINGYEVEGTPEEIRRLVGAPQVAPNPLVPSPTPYPTPAPVYPYAPNPWGPVYPPVWCGTGNPPAIYGTSAAMDCVASGTN